MLEDSFREFQIFVHYICYSSETNQDVVLHVDETQMGRNIYRNSNEIQDNLMIYIKDKYFTKIKKK